MKDFILVAVVVAILLYLSRNRAKVIAALQKANPVQQPVSTSQPQPTGSVDLNTPAESTTNVVISTDDGNSFVISDSVPLTGGSIQLN